VTSIATIKRKAFPLQYHKQLQKQKDVILGLKKEELAKKLGFDNLSLPRDIPDDLDEFYKGFEPIINTDTLERVEHPSVHAQSRDLDLISHVISACRVT